MTSPIEQITVVCPNCGEKYSDWFRASMNLQMDDFDEDYIEEASSSTCIYCGFKVRHDVLVVKEDGLWVQGPVTGSSNMDEKFAAHIAALHPKFEAMLAMSPVSPASLPKDVPGRGIYLFSEGDEHLYVGRSNTIRKRLQTHCRPSSGHNGATFAFLLACEQYGRGDAAYKGLGSRSDREKTPEFAAMFSATKERVREMDVRYVEENDPTTQAILEIYAAIALETRYNDFDNH
jgi:hypothetical protein